MFFLLVPQMLPELGTGKISVWSGCSYQPGPKIPAMTARRMSLRDLIAKRPQQTCCASISDLPANTRRTWKLVP
jgi:hypothetical protein